MERNKLLGLALMAFIGAILFVVFADTIADNVQYQNNPVTITDEILNIASVRYADGNPSINASQYLSLAHNNWTTDVVVVTMANGSALTANVDYYVNTSNNKINFSNTTRMFTMVQNTTLVDYKYYHADYISDGTSRTVNGFTLLFFVIGGVILVWYYAKKQLEESGM